MGLADVNFAIFSLFITPLIVFLSIVIFLAALGKTVGVRYLYIRALIAVFEWGKQRIERHESKDQIEEHDKIHNEDESDDIQNGEAEGNNTTVIQKEIARQRSLVELDEGFQLPDAMYFAKNGIEAIIEDDVTQRFDAAELSSWNLLTRTNTNYQFISLRLTILWFLGCVLRYAILFPFRVILTFFAIGLMMTGTFFIGYLPSGKFKKWIHTRLALTAYRIMCRAFSAVVTFHHPENRARGGGICVANHTSPVDIIILGCDNCYAMVGQAHGGFVGTMQRAFSRGESHVWFQRSEVKDRLAVAKRLKDHVADPNKLPILIFPEGTCINNTSIMMFKKGSFEVGSTIYPVAIKYDSRFADPFWNSGKQAFSRHLAMILTSWALVAEVWYLPPCKQRENESAVDFANRVKSEIAREGGLVDLEWDGGLKRQQPKPIMLERKQQEYSKRLKGE